MMPRIKRSMVWYGPQLGMDPPPERAGRVRLEGLTLIGLDLSAEYSAPHCGPRRPSLRAFAQRVEAAGVDASRDEVREAWEDIPLVGFRPLHVQDAIDALTVAAARPRRSASPLVPRLDRARGKSLLGEESGSEDEDDANAPVFNRLGG